MFGKIHTVLHLFLSFCAIGGIALCTHGSYLNLCGHCVGGTTDKSDLEGLDRCGICDGQSDCVGCDGIINSPRKRDTCGLCLPPDAEQWNDCRKIESVYPPVLDLSVDSALLPLTIMGAGLAQSDMNTTQCHILPLESQPDSPAVKEISLEESEIQVKVLLSKSAGKYRVGCSEIEGFAELRIVDSRRLNAVNVKPSEVTVDATVELEVEIEEDNSGNTNGTYWCFVRMRADETRTLPAIRKTDKSFKCAKYTATTPGTFLVGVVAHEDAAVGENSTGRTTKLHSRARPPVAETAAYSPDLQNIAITFDQNINILDCNGTFSSETAKTLGKGFTCTAVADTLYVTPGDGLEFAESVTIIDGNSIRRDGSSEAELSPSARAVTLPVSKQNVMTPRFTLSLPNAVCADKTKQPVINVMVSRLGKQRLDYTWAAPPMKEGRRSQRENLLMWRHARSVEAQLNNQSQTDGFLFNRTSLRPGLNYILNLRSRNALGDHKGLTANLKIPEEGNISVTVTAFPSTSAIVAEVRVVFCTDNDRPSLRYSWSVNGNVVSAEGKLIIIPGINPGTYNISCTIYNYHTNQILGMDSAVSEVVKLPQRVVIFPTNTVVGTMDDITLQAYSGETRLRWSCSTSQGEPCITVGPKAYPIEDIVDVTSPTVRIPAGTLPVGSYIWTLNGLEDATAGVTIAPKIPPDIKLVPPPVEVDSTKPLSMNADIERLKPGCRIKWKTTRRKGYHYFDLQGDVGLGDQIEIQVDDPIVGEREAPLVIPPARGKWKGLIGGAMYLLTLQTICPEFTPEAHVDVTVVVNSPPSGTDVQITPETGQAINTQFSIRISEGLDSVGDYPLVYRISYRDESDEIQMGVSVLTDFMVTLPPGNLTVVVKSCDIRDSCSESSQPVLVEEAGHISSGAIKGLAEEIRNDMLSGETISAYGKAITAFKSLSGRAEDKEKLNEILSATESAIRDRLSDLKGRLRSDSNLIKPSFDFLEQSVTSLKFFPDAKELVKILTEFKNLITKSSTLSRRKRETIGQTEKEMTLAYKDSLVGRPLDRPTRSAVDVKVNENTIRAIFDLHAKILEQNDTDSNREEFLKDVRKYMLETCTSIQDSVQGPILIESSIVSLEVMKLTQNDLKKDLQITGAPNAKFRFNLKSIPRKTCAAIAKYKDDFMGIANGSRVGDLFEVRLIKNGTFRDSFKDEVKSMVITLPLRNVDPHGVLDCMIWNKDNGWKPSCALKTKAEDAITCNCKDSGIFSAFVTSQTAHDAVVSVINTTTPSLNTTVGTTTTVTTITMLLGPGNNFTTPVTTTSTSTTITTTTTTTTTTPTTPITTVTNTNTTTAAPATTPTNYTPVRNVGEPRNSTLSTTMQSMTTILPNNATATTKSSPSTDKDVLTSVIQDISNIRGNSSTLYVSGTFRIEEDYKKIVGKNETAFKENLRKQLAQQLSIPENVIANVIIKPGSILVTVLFIDTEETKAEAAIKELVTKLHEGSLRLTSQNATVLQVPQQDLKVKIGSPLSRNTGKVRLITYGVVVGTLIVIFLFAVGATYVKRKRTRMPLRLPRLSIDDHPTYRQFHNEFSLDGSSATLARYRRDHPFETETMQ